VTAGTVAETRVMVAAMTAVEREAALKEGGLMEEVKVVATAVMVATVASAEKRVGTASIAANLRRSGRLNQPSI